MNQANRCQCDECLKPMTSDYAIKDEDGTEFCEDCWNELHFYPIE